MASDPRVLSIVWNLIRGGTEGQCARVALHAARGGHVHRVAVFRREGFFLQAVEAACGPVHTIGITRLATPDTVRRARALRDFIRAERIDVVHAWDCDAAIFGSIAARWAGVPFITSRRDLGQIYPPHKLWLMHRADVGARAVVVNATAIAKWVEASGIAPGRVVRIPNVVDVADFDRQALQASDADSILPNGRLVGMVARLDAEKDVGTFIRAGADVFRTHSDVRFVIAGDGPERTALGALASGLGVADRMCFLGDITWVPQLTRKLTAGVLTPRANEGQSNTILEYMAGSLPVVATDCGGNAELVEHGVTGFVAPAGDSAALAGALRRILDDPARAQAMGAAGRRKTEAHRPETVGQRFATLYAQAVQEAASTP